MPSASSVVTPESSGGVSTTPAPMSDTDNYGSEEGFVFRSAVGASFQQPLSGRSGSNLTYNKWVFQPGIRFDLEPGYNVYDWFRVGLESSFIYNQIHSISSNSAAFYNGSTLGNGGFYNGSYWYKGKIFQFNLLNQALTATQITNYYNATRGRYGV
jgi:hypothetical protein